MTTAAPTSRLPIPAPSARTSYGARTARVWRAEAAAAIAGSPMVARPGPPGPAASAHYGAGRRLVAPSGHFARAVARKHPRLFAGLAGHHRDAPGQRHSRRRFPLLRHHGSERSCSRRSKSSSKENGLPVPSSGMPFLWSSSSTRSSTPGPSDQSFTSSRQ